MKKQQAGFTLIELVVVIVILGILAATALPKFVDMNADAKQARVKGVAGAVSAAAAMAFAQAVAQGTHASYSAAGNCILTNIKHDAPSCSASYAASVCTITCDSYSATATVDYT